MATSWHFPASSGSGGTNIKFPKKSGGGIPGPVDDIIGNLLSDTRDAAVGFLPGVVHTAVHPIDTAKTIGKAYWHDWSPLFHGDFKKLGHQFVEHPLGYLLDAATVATLGAGAEVTVPARIASLLLRTLPKEAIGRVVERSVWEDAALHVKRLTPQHSGLKELHAPKGDGINGIWEKSMLPGSPVYDNVETTVEGAAKAQVKRTVKEFEYTKLGKKLNRLQDRAATRHRIIKGIPGAGEAYKFYHHNPVIRFRQKTIEGLNTKVADAVGGPGTAERLRHQRFLNRSKGRRGAALNTMFKRQMATADALLKTGRLHPDAIFKGIDDSIKKNIREHGVVFSEDDFFRHGLHPDFMFVSDHPAPHLPPENANYEGIGDWIKTSGQRHVYKPPSNRYPNLAYKDPNGNFRIVRKKDIDHIINEAHGTWETFKDLGTYQGLTRLWKSVILGLAPRYFVNNVIGNSIMYMMSSNPIAAGRGIADAIRQVHGKHVLEKSLNELDREWQKLNGDWVDHYYMATQQGIGYDLTSDIARRTKGGRRTLSSLNLFSVTHNVSDIFVRRAAINRIIRDDPTYKRLYFEHRAMNPEMSAQEAHIKAATEASKNDAVRHSVAEKVDDILGQYDTYTKAEKHVKNFVPFYGWNRAITRHTISMVAERPYEAAVVARVGQQGVDDTQKVLGKLPKFLQGVIPFGPADSEGRKGVLTTQGLNPYASFPDTVEAVGALVGSNPQLSESLAGQLNPLLSGAVEAVTKRSLLTGAPVPTKGGILGTAVLNAAEATPPYRLVDRLYNGTRKPTVDSHGNVKPLLYKGDLKQEVLSVFGIPVKEMSTARASALADAETGTKKFTIKSGGSSSLRLSKGKLTSGRSSSRTTKRAGYSSSLSGLRISSSKRILSNYLR